MTNAEMHMLIDETIDLLRIWEKVDEIGDCLIWKASDNGHGNPQFKSRATGRAVLVRRYVMEMHGIKLKRMEPLGCRCGDTNCINPEHLYKSSTKAIAKAAARRGAFSSPVRASRIANTKRKAGKLTIEQAREIRVSTESAAALALKFGVNRSLINGIRAGTRWKDYSNPFAQLMAA